MAERAFPKGPPMEDAAGERWQAAMVAADATIQDVIRNLDATALQIALVVDEKGSLTGTITDGDIRRGLLRGLALTDSAEGIVHREPLVVPPDLSRDLILQLMQANKIRQLPVVDESRRLVGLHTWDELIVSADRANLMVIMAGGRGTRMGSRTESCPKPMLPVGGKPMLEHIITRAKTEGFHRFILAIHHLGNLIEDYFGDGSSLGVNIAYLREKQPLGTAGAIALLEPRPEESFVVTNGDVLTDIKYGELLDFHNRHLAGATMAVRLHETQHAFGVVRTNGVEIVGFDEKPVARHHVNAGVYALRPQSVDVLTKNEYCDMPSLFLQLQAQGQRCIAYAMHEPWLDVGNVGDLERANSIPQKGT